MELQLCYITTSNRGWRIKFYAAIYCHAGTISLAIGVTASRSGWGRYRKTRGGIKIDGGEPFSQFAKYKNNVCICRFPRIFRNFFPPAVPVLSFASCTDRMSLSLFHRKSRISAWSRGNRSVSSRANLEVLLTKIKVIRTMGIKLIILKLQMTVGRTFVSI